MRKIDNDISEMNFSRLDMKIEFQKIQKSRSSFNFTQISWNIRVLVETVGI